MTGIPKTVIHDPDDVIVLTQEDYQQLQYDSALLYALETAGVDNWEGYEIAIQLLNGDLDEDDL